MRNRSKQAWEMNAWQPDLSQKQTYQEIDDEAKILNPVQRHQQVTDILAQALVDYLWSIECEKLSIECEKENSEKIS